MRRVHVLRTIDFLMLLCLPILMGGAIIGDSHHEVLGTLMFLFVVVHHILNRWWHKTLFKGKYSPKRVLSLVTDLLFVIDILLLMFSGVVISTFVFGFVETDSLYGTSRLVHLCGSYWGLVLMSFHAGLHIPYKRIWNWLKRFGKPAQIFAVAVVASVCGFGFYYFIQNNFMDYLFLRTHFAFIDFDQMVAVMVLKYACTMALFAAVGTSVGAAAGSVANKSIKR